MGVTEGELNLVRQRRLIIFTGVIEPDLSDSDLQDRFNRGSRDFTAIVDNLFLLGEQIDISDKIMELSGINDDDVDSEETLGENTFLPGIKEDPYAHMIAMLSLRWHKRPKKFLKYPFGELQFMYAALLYELEMQSKRATRIAGMRNRFANRLRGRKQASQTAPPPQAPPSEPLNKGGFNMNFIRNMMGNRDG